MGGVRREERRRCLRAERQLWTIQVLRGVPLFNYREYVKKKEDNCKIRLSLYSHKQPCQQVVFVGQGLESAHRKFSAPRIFLPVNRNEK